MVKKIAIIQARLSSTRLPGKVLEDLCGKTLLERVVEKVKSSELLDEVWVATSTDKKDDLIEIVGLNLGVKVHRGSLNNVLNRFCEVAQKSNADIVVRVTADNPLTEPRLIDAGIQEIINNNNDYVHFENIPYGSGVEIITKNSLLESLSRTDKKEDLEHVTLFIKRNKDEFSIKLLSPDFNLKQTNISLTIDTLDDYVELFKLYSHFCNIKKGHQITLEDAITFFEAEKNNR